MPDTATCLYALAGLILLYKIGRFLALGPQPDFGKEWL